VKPQLAISTRFSRDQYAVAVKEAVSHGFSGLDWNLDPMRIAVASNARRKFYDCALSSGLPSRFHAPCHDTELGHEDPLISSTAVQYLKMYIHLIKDFPKTSITLHIGSRGIPMEELSWDNAVRGLREVVRFGEDNGVDVCLENLKHGWTNNPETFSELVEASGSMVTFDIGHARASPYVSGGDYTLEEFMESVGDRIRNLHVYEIESKQGEHIEPANLDSIRPALDRALSKGITWWVLELHSIDSMARCKNLIESHYG
jgi:sugar phosphate isomerase/epimerase